MWVGTRGSDRLDGRHLKVWRLGPIGTKGNDKKGLKRRWKG
jgi:hypothetical protein